MKTERQFIPSHEQESLAHLAQEAERALQDIEYQEEQAQQTAEELEQKELEALLIASQKEEAERKAQEHESNIERVAGE